MSKNLNNVELTEEVNMLVFIHANRSKPPGPATASIREGIYEMREAAKTGADLEKEWEQS